MSREDPSKARATSAYCADRCHKGAARICNQTAQPTALRRPTHWLSQWAARCTSQCPPHTAQPTTLHSPPHCADCRHESAAQVCEGTQLYKSTARVCEVKKAGAHAPIPIAIKLLTLLKPTIKILMIWYNTHAHWKSKHSLTSKTNMSSLVPVVAVFDYATFSYAFYSTTRCYDHQRKNK